MAPTGGDHFRWWWPTFVSFLLLAHSAHARTDLSLGGSARSYPLSGVVEVESGYSGLLWGQTGSPWYGYWRARLDGASALHYNSLGGAVEFFPLAFVGVRAGGEGIQNDQDYSAYDCAEVRCLGRFYKTFAEAELSLGAGPVFVQGRWRRERWTQKDPQGGDFIEPTSALLMRSQGDSQTIYQALGGVKLGSVWTVIAGLRYAENDNGDMSRYPFAILRYQQGRLTVGAGGGVFESERKAHGGSALGYVRWEISPSFALE